MLIRSRGLDRGDLKPTIVTVSRIKLPVVSAPLRKPLSLKLKYKQLVF